MHLVINRGWKFWAILCPGWVLLLYLIVAQGIPAFDYRLGVQMGTQEPAAAVTDVGVAFFKGFAIGDVITYIPLLAVGLIGYTVGRAWGRVVLAAALGITVYWPAVCLATVASTSGIPGWNLANETVYWVVLPLIALWGAFALWLVIKQ